MSETMTIAAHADNKQVPADATVRAAIRARVQQIAADLPRQRPLCREELEAIAAGIVQEMSLPPALLGFVMVTVSNAFWEPLFTAVPYAQRLLLLPNCLRAQGECTGTFDSEGLHCAGCGGCDIAGLQRAAEALGYRVIVAEGTTSVLTAIMQREADAILGVACLDSLEKSYLRLADLGLPYLAVPLLNDGCVDTEAELQPVQAYLTALTPNAGNGTRSYLPLLREAVRTFEASTLTALLAPYTLAAGVGLETERIALTWLERGGKRLRPFVTLGAYATAKYGDAALRPDAVLEAMIPDAIRRLGVAIEAMHKASLAHDDVEDDDAFRYGVPTLHRSYGVPTAINSGDYLVGLGYRLIAGEALACGAECVSDILGRLAAAQLDLCRGQGEELQWQRDGVGELRPLDVLAMYALKTSPAFEVALYAGIRAAGTPVESARLRQYCLYLGEAYQVLNDLDDWRDEGNKIFSGGDAAAQRPTILRALALQAGGAGALATAGTSPEEIRRVYDALGAFTQAAQLVAKLRERALRIAGEMAPPALGEFLAFLVQMILPERNLHG